MAPPDEQGAFVPADVVRIVEDLVNEWDLEEKRLMVERHSAELLGEYADIVLRNALAEAEEDGGDTGPDVTSGLEWHRALLTDCRSVGVAEAFARRMRPDERAELTPGVLDRMATLSQEADLLRFLLFRPGVRHLTTRAVAALRNATDRAGKQAILERDRALLLTPLAEYWARMCGLPEEHVDFLARARTEGVEAALTHMFGPAPDHYADQVPAELRVLLAELLQPESSVSPERAVALCGEGLAQAEPGTLAWAALKGRLARTLLLSQSRDRAAAIEDAVGHAAEVARYAVENGDTLTEATMRALLATAFCERIRGSRTDNLDRAVAEADTAVDILDRERHADPRAGARVRVDAHAAAATAYLGRAASGDLRRARRHAEAALRHAGAGTARSTLAEIHRTLGLIAEATGRDYGNIRAIGHLERARGTALASDEPDIWVAVSVDLARLHLERDHTRPQEDVVTAITILNEALTRVDPVRRPAAWAAVHAALGEAYRWRRSGEEQADLALVVEHAEKALSVFTREDFPREWARALSLRADGLRRSLRGHPLINTRDALADYTELAGFYHEAGDERSWADMQERIGFTHASPAMADHEPGHLPQAIDHLECALAAFQRQHRPDAVALVRRNLVSIGAVALIRGVATPDLAGKIRRHSARILRGFPSAEQRYGVHRALGLLDFDAGAHARAAKHLTKALEVVRPPDAGLLDVYRHLALLRRRRGERAEAVRLCLTGARLGEELLASAGSGYGEHHLIDSVSGLHQMLALWALADGAWSRALALLERSKSWTVADAPDPDPDLTGLPESVRSRVVRARKEVRGLEAALRTPEAAENGEGPQINRRLAVARAELAAALCQAGTTPAASRTAAEPTGASVCAAVPQGGVLVMPIVGDEEAAMFVIPAGTPEPAEANVVRLPGVNLAKLRDAESRWLKTSSQWELGNVPFAMWAAEIGAITAWLWEAVAGPLTQALRDLGVPEGTTLWLAGSELSRHLPVHAARCHDEGRGRTLLDDHPIAYIPCAGVLSGATRRAARMDPAEQRLTVFCDPLGDLPWASSEADGIVEQFSPGMARVVRGPAVTWEAVAALSPGATYLHFACHAGVNWIQPDFSHITLADGFLLTAAHLRGLDLGGTRLAVLSACQTGVPGTIGRRSAEHIGLAAGLLSAGAPGVVATLWSVEDESTALFMRRFYALMIGQGRSPVQAMREAQLWLRDVTVAELTGLDSGARRQSRGRSRSGRPTGRPFQSPYYWAAFHLVGT